MQTIIVEVYVPAISGSFDFRLPARGHIGDIVREMTRTLEATQMGLLFDKDQPLLFDRENGKILPNGLTVAEIKLRDGSQLMLV